MQYGEMIPSSRTGNASGGETPCPGDRLASAARRPLHDAALTPLSAPNPEAPFTAPNPTPNVMAPLDTF